jgi:SOS-response transcriptional repressor LexA
MSSIKAARLKAAREKAGYSSAADAARAFGWTESAYRHHENGTRGFGADAAKRYGRAFKVKPGWLLGLDNVDSGPPPHPNEDDRLMVNGSVEAGVWRASENWNDERAFVIEGIPSPVPGARRFGLVVVGHSMDECYEPGTVLGCVSIFDTDVRPNTGDHVICECIRSDGLRELTVKEYREENGRYWLVPRSSKPEFKPVELPGPDLEHIGESEIRVIAFVVGNYPPRTLDLLRRMGLVKPA